MTTPSEPNWFPDPSGKPGQVYWDGQQWHTDVPATGYSPDEIWSVGPVSNTNGTKSATRTGNVDSRNATCQRALTVANNVAIDVAACGTSPGSQSGAAAYIARQIAAKVPTT
jgi:serine/threonine kinase PknH